jgi:hypothetical protein
MNERKQSLVVLVASCLLMLVGVPLLWLTVMYGDVMDLSMAAASPLRQMDIVWFYLGFMAIGTAFILLTAGICARLGKVQGAATAPVAKPEVAARPVKVRPPAQGAGSDRLPMGGALPKGSG